MRELYWEKGEPSIRKRTGLPLKLPVILVAPQGTATTMASRVTSPDACGSLSTRKQRLGQSVLAGCPAEVPKQAI